MQDFLKKSPGFAMPPFSKGEIVLPPDKKQSRRRSARPPRWVIVKREKRRLSLFDGEATAMPSEAIQTRTKIKKNARWAIFFLISGRQDLNLRPLAPQASALPGCATPRNYNSLTNCSNLQIE